MKTFYALAAAAVVLTGNSIPRGAATTYTALREKSSLTYVLVHPLHRVEAVTKDVSCEIEYDDATHSVTHVRFSADVMSFDSGNSNRDSHAMELVEALLYPSVSFESTAVTSDGPNLMVDGNLTFHGKTGPVRLMATQRLSDSTLDVTGTAKVSLTAFDVSRPTLLMIPTEDTLSVSFTMVFPRQERH